jgi:signal transduction histidine kinase
MSPAAFSFLAWAGLSHQESHRLLIAAAIVLIVLQLALIALRLAQRSRRRRAEDAARSNEAALRASDGRARQLAGGLITAQESERTRIARDLHDGLCQEIAGVSVAISHLKHHRGRVQDAAVQEALFTLQQQTKALAESVRLLSHHLHPTVLQHVGLVAAVDALCAETERQYAGRVLFSGSDDWERIGADIELCLFGITQEALRNAFTHGGAKRAAVSITRSGRSLDLTVVDDGKGFDVARARQNGGLGLLSIEERARLVGGELTAVDSYLQQGTIVHASIPAPPASCRASSEARQLVLSVERCVVCCEDAESTRVTSVYGPARC